MAFISKSCEYGMRAALYVAAQKKEAGYVPIREISDKLDISFHFLTKILQQLTESGIMRSYRGPSGGVQLTRTLNTISLYDVVIAIEGDAMFTQCVLGLEGCGEKTPCPLHARWEIERARLTKMFVETTLDRMSKQVNKDGLRLSDLE